MTTLLEWLHLLGVFAWKPIWVPVLSWTAFAVPVWLGLEWSETLHPRTEYRFRQLLLGTLPLGVFLTALVGPWLGPSGLAVVPASTVSLPAVDVRPIEQPVHLSWTWMQVVGALTGVAALLAAIRLYTLISNTVSVRRLHASVSASGSSALQRQVDQVSSELGVTRPVRAHFSSQASVPMTLGGTRPLILLPPSLADSPDALTMTLRHECVHIRRYDDLCQFWEHLIAAVFYVHPLTHRLRRSIENARERACDAAVLDDAGTMASTYAQLLLDFAETPHRPTGALSLSESPSSLKRRLLAMQSSFPHRIQSSRGLAISILGLGIALTFGIVGCSEGLAPSGQTDPSTNDVAASDLPASTDLNQEPSIEGGLEALTQEIEYPSLAKEAGIEGQVFVQFVVTETGNAEEVHIAKAVHPTLDSAAVKAVQRVDFLPGQKDGQPVATRMTLPVSFQLPDQESSGDPASTERETASVKTPNALEIVGGPAALRDAVSYPKLQRKAGIEGTVVVVATIDRDGRVEEAHVKKSVHEALDAAALQAVRSVRFSSSNGQDLTPSEVTLPITFALPKKADA